MNHHDTPELPSHESREGLRRTALLMRSLGLDDSELPADVRHIEERHARQGRREHAVHPSADRQ